MEENKERLEEQAQQPEEKKAKRELQPGDWIKIAGIIIALIVVAVILCFI